MKKKKKKKRRKTLKKSVRGGKIQMKRIGKREQGEEGKKKQ